MFFVLFIVNDTVCLFHKLQTRPIFFRILQIRYEKMEAYEEKNHITDKLKQSFQKHDYDHIIGEMHHYHAVSPVHPQIVGYAVTHNAIPVLEDYFEPDDGLQRHFKCAVHVAIIHGDVEVFEYLNGRNPYQIDLEDALILTIKKVSSLSMITYLIETLHVNPLCRQGDPITQAIHIERPVIIRYLLDQCPLLPIPVMIKLAKTTLGFSRPATWALVLEHPRFVELNYNRMLMWTCS